MKEAKIEKSRYFRGQNLAIGLTEYCKIKVLSGSNFSGKIRLLFALFWVFFAKKRAWSKVRGSESQSDLPYCSLLSPGHVQVQKFLLQHFLVLLLYIAKVVFF